jgi:hypothetical protein
MSLRHRQLLGVALFPLGAFAVHQLRYQLAFGSHASNRLAQQGHAYLHDLTPWIVLALALGLGQLSARVARAWSDGESERSRGRSALVLWALASAGLFSIYVGQELLEGLFAAGHPQGLAGVIGNGGLWAVPAAACIGALLALVVRGGRALVAHVARLHGRRRRHVARRAPACLHRSKTVALPRLAPLAGASAGRAPPRRR